jgi:hypothetical protein
MHLTKTATYGVGDLLAGRVLLYGARSPRPSSPVRGFGKKVVGRTSDRVFVLLVEAGLVVAGLLFLAGF